MTKPLRSLEPSSFHMPTGGDWFVLHTKSRQEKLLAGDLLAKGIGCYLPLRRQVRFYGRRKVSVQLPLFPGYVFLRGDRDQAFEADRTRHVARIITVSDQNLIDWELNNIHLALLKDAPLDPFPYLSEGSYAEVRSGPFRGLQGMVEKRHAPDRLILQIDMLGRALSLEVDASLLEPLDR